MRTVVAVGLISTTAILAAIGTAVALAQPGTAQPDTKPASTTDTAPKQDEAAKPKWPAIVKKSLSAKNDYRGKQAPKFEVEKWLTDEPKREGKVVFIDFWATWCPPCRALIPELNKFQEEFKDDMVVIGVSGESEADVKKFMSKTKVKYSMAIDTKDRMSETLGIEGIPHVMIVDSTGVVRWQGFPGGSEKLTESIVKQIIEADKLQRSQAKPKESEPAKKSG